jgi:hypothetical protein
MLWRELYKVSAISEVCDVQTLGPQRLHQDVRHNIQIIGGTSERVRHSILGMQALSKF